MILANRTHQIIKSIMHHGQVGFIQQIQGCCKVCKSINVINRISRSKGKNRMIILIDAEKDWQNPTSIRVKNPEESIHRQTLFQFIKAIYDQPIDKIIVNTENLECFPYNQSGTRQRCPSSPILFNIVLENSTRTIRDNKIT